MKRSRSRQHPDKEYKLSEHASAPSAFSSISTSYLILLLYFAYSRISYSLCHSYLSRYPHFSRCSLSFYLSEYAITRGIFRSSSDSLFPFLLSPFPFLFLSLPRAITRRSIRDPVRRSIRESIQCSLFGLGYFGSELRFRTRSPTSSGSSKTGTSSLVSCSCSCRVHYYIRPL